MEDEAPQGGEVAVYHPAGTMCEKNCEIKKWQAMAGILGPTSDVLTFRHSGTDLEMRWAFFNIASFVTTRDGIWKNGPDWVKPESPVSTS